MKRIKYRTVDKSTWPNGPWMNEPDKVQWLDEATGMPCLIVRGPSGALCGYVGVPVGHPWHAKEVDLVWDTVPPIEVHGGITYAAGCNHPDDESQGICHKVEDGEPDNVWWLGFDCAHAGDRSPAIEAHYKNDPILGKPMCDAVYRTFNYVRREVENLAKQAQEAA